MVMVSLLEKCNRHYKTQSCCHKDDRKCSCYECLREDYYSRPDSYSCIKKLCYYVMNYEPAYASEIYHLLSKTRLLERRFIGSRIRILSIGCGVSPELYALDKYINEKEIDVSYIYLGIDCEKGWNSLREQKSNICSGQFVVLKSNTTELESICISLERRWSHPS